MMLSNTTKLVTIVNMEYNTKQHNETSNFITDKTLHEVGIGFCRPNQTHM